MRVPFARQQVSAHLPGDQLAGTASEAQLRGPRPEGFDRLGGEAGPARGSPQRAAYDINVPDGGPCRHGPSPVRGPCCHPLTPARGQRDLATEWGSPGGRPPDLHEVGTSLTMA